MRIPYVNTLLLVLLFAITFAAIVLGSEFWMRFFWCLSTILFYGIYSQYVLKKYITMELLFLLSLIGNIFTLFHDQWYFSELALLSFSGAYAALLVYLYNRRGTHNLDKSFRPFFIGAFIINLILVILMLTEFSIYFDNPLMLPIFIIYFILTLALAGMAFLHFNSVATSQSLHLLGFIVGIIMADVLRFLDHYYYNSVSLQLGALFLYSGGYYLAYRRMVIYAEHKTRKYILQEVSEIKNE